MAPIASFGLAAVVMSALLVGFGGQHSGSPNGQTMDPAAKLGPLSAAATLNTNKNASVHGAISGSRGRKGAVQPLRVTAPSTTVVTHPTPTTTVTTVTTTVVKPTKTLIVTTVTTTTAHPATPVTASITHATTPLAATTTTTTVKTTTTTVPTPTTIPTQTAASNAVGAVPNAPANLDPPTTMVFDDEFNTGSLNTSVWSPDWFGSGSTSNGTVMLSSNVSVGANGLALQLNSPQSGGLVSTNPDDGQPGHTGFQIAPTPTKPVFVEFKATLPATASGTVANWPALWLDGQVWPEDGEIDLMEGGYGYTAFHVHYGTGSSTAQGATVNDLSGTHTYGVLWTTTGFTFLYDGADVGTVNVALTSPEYILMENSYSSVDPIVFPTTMYIRYVRVWN